MVLEPGTCIVLYPSVSGFNDFAVFYPMNIPSLNDNDKLYGHTYKSPWIRNIFKIFIFMTVKYGMAWYFIFHMYQGTVI